MPSLSSIARVLDTCYRLLVACESAEMPRLGFVARVYTLTLSLGPPQHCRCLQLAHGEASHVAQCGCTMCLEGLETSYYE